MDKEPGLEMQHQRHIGSSGVNNELINLGQISVKAKVNVTYALK